jgi:two-component system sensor histidine kinase KdpD
MAISRGFIEAMGGTIGAVNRTDRPGAVFIINLPVPKPPERLDTAA